MKRILFLLLTGLFGYQVASGQLWVDQQFTYDSLLNVAYGTAVDFNGELDTLHMDIYLPKCEETGPPSPRPLLMWIHGGAFLAGDKNDVSIQALCKEFAQRGYVTASIDYRLGFVADDVAWQCNYPNYSCVFAADSAEWIRAYYRAVQDAKGALRYLVNRHQTFGIDPHHLFVAGESAGAFAALGVGLLDTLTERPAQTLALSDVPSPHATSLACGYNQGQVFDDSTVSRPDLGGIEGEIEPTTLPFTIKGIGNMYGAMFDDLLKDIPADKPRPAIYSFHQPCDIVVPIDSNFVYWGLSWCFTNGYNCFGIRNNRAMLYGSRTFSQWNTAHNYGYDIQNAFTSTNFPYNFLFGPGSCLDQVSNPCHAYDSRSLRANNLAEFFSTHMTLSPPCDTTSVAIKERSAEEAIAVYPNPVADFLHVKSNPSRPWQALHLYDNYGRNCYWHRSLDTDPAVIDLRAFAVGVYLLLVEQADGSIQRFKVIKR
jgi:acetyl esterase/lipase